MRDKISTLIRQLEQCYSIPIQVSVEWPKETELVIQAEDMQILYPVEKLLHGSFNDRSCEVLPLPTDDQGIQHDLGLIVGNYASLQQLNEKINAIPHLHNFCDFAQYFDRDLLRHLAGKYTIQETVVGIAHGGVEDWYLVDGAKADLHDWEMNRPDIFNEALLYLKEQNITFRYNDLIATPTGVYLQKINDFHYVEDFADYINVDSFTSLLLKKKIADIKLDLLK